jgi:hypothetical protein
MPRHLCDPGKAILDAMLAHGQSFTMPTIELDQPLYEPLGAGQQTLHQVVVKAGVIEAIGMHYPTLVFTGRSATGPLPQWAYPADDEQLRALAVLVHDMAELAIRTADEANAGRRGG